MNNRKIKSIIQALPTLSSRDAIGEEVLLMDRVFRSLGLDTEILTQDWDLRRPRESWDGCLVLYHYSIGSRLAYKLLEWDAPFVVRFHNITPLTFFSEFTQEEQTLNACQLGIQQIPLLVKKSRAVLSVSQYNAKSLEGASQCSILPILRDYSPFVKKKYVEKTKDPQFLFVGRLSPNKCQHDLIEILALYKKFYDARARMILVGGSFSSLYRDSLLQLAKALDLSVGFNIDKRSDFDLTFTRELSESDLAHLYHESSLFISMSEHEGFCVPLVEAMHAELPILAHESSAIVETLSGCGILVNKKDKISVLKAIEKIMRDSELQKKLIQLGLTQNKAYALFHSQKLLEAFLLKFEG